MTAMETTERAAAARQQAAGLTALHQRIAAYRPQCEQEEADKNVLLSCIERYPDVLTRENKLCHMTASAWIINGDGTRVLMAYHNIYDSWSWTGGHADGEADLLQVALREAREETGLVHVRPVSTDIYSLEILTVDGHWKRGKYVSSHLHLNATYLLAADEDEALFVKPDENSGVRWMSLSEAVSSCSERNMRPVYEKLNGRIQAQLQR